jgi:D-alanyl-lipoteichoic acid acyltransferase DltB (MBOAT superfamily)
MSFNSAVFAAFLLGFFVLFCLVPLGRMWKLALIVFGSALFYAAWDVRFVPLLWFTALLDFLVARRIDGSADSAARKRWLVLSLVANLGVLGLFKYLGFLSTTAFGLVSLFGVTAVPWELHVLLPAGVSFYTFQSMSYTIDVYRKEIPARNQPLELLAAVSFFPHLVAGPIIRAKVLLPQFDDFKLASWQQFRIGVALATVGLLKKTIADFLGGPSDALFTSASPSALDAWTGALAFAGQIYGDFSGYTDIAIGVAAMLGFSLPKNFDQPYLATSPVDFWRRWHISLSSWLRDYLYIPLGGNRKRRWLNLMLTMLLGGLWHGASWTFVAWGGYHGGLLAGQHALGLTKPSVGAMRWVSRAVTFYLVLLGWVLFRAASFKGALEVLKAMHGFGAASSLTWSAAATLVFVVVGLVLCHLATHLFERKPLTEKGPWLWPVTAALLAVCFAVGAGGRAFIYFQF